MTDIILSLKGLSKSYDSHQVLDEIDFLVRRGTIMGLVGKNGAGKTTLIKCLLGLLKIDQGEARVFNEPSWNLSCQSKHRIGYVPQHISGFGWMTVTMLLTYTGTFYDHWNQEKVKNMLKEWELNPNAKVSSLSEGERQKLAIIQAMGHEPEVLILDEPVATLDPVSRRKFIKELINLNLSEDKTVLFSTHITSDLERVAAKITLLKDRKINYLGDLSTLQERFLRLRIQSRKELPAALPIHKIIHVSVDNNSAVVTVDTGDGIDEADIKRMEKELSAMISIEHLNLEEIFLEINK